MTSVVVRIVALVLSVTACGGDDGGNDEAASVASTLQSLADRELPESKRVEALYDAAKREGSVVLYSTSNLELLEPWAEAFEDAFPGVDLEYVRLKSDDLYDRAVAEGAAGRTQADVIHANAVVGAALHERGRLADHLGVPVPDGYPASEVGDWSVTSYISPNVIAWNTDEIASEDAPRDLDAFLLPEHSGCVIDTGSESFVAALIRERGADGAREWIEGFLANGGVVRDGHSATAAEMAAGHERCTVDVYVHAVEELTADGAALAWTAPDPTPANATSAYLERDAPHPNAAALLMHFMLAEEGASIVADGGRISVHPDVEQRYPGLAAWVEPGTEEHDRLFVLTPDVAEGVAVQTIELVQELLIPNLVAGG